MSKPSAYVDLGTDFYCVRLKVASYPRGEEITVHIGDYDTGHKAAVAARQLNKAFEAAWGKSLDRRD